MSKSIIPFLNQVYWETNPNCDICATIDKFYHDIINGAFTDTFSKTEFLDDNYLVDGYRILGIYEKNGYILYNTAEIMKLKTYKDSNHNFLARMHNYLYPHEIPLQITDYYEADAPTIMYSRWCQRCGARKPEIYDPHRSESFDLLKILNFTVESINGKIRVSWRDSESSLWKKTRLFRDGVQILELTQKNKYDSTYYEETMPDGIIYKYKVGNYDIDDFPIQITEEKQIYVPIMEDTPPLAATDTTARQVMELRYTGTDYENKNVILIDWKDPIDDCAGTILRMGEKFFVPADEIDGVEAKKHIFFDDYNIEIGHTYYFRPFPYDREKIKPDIGTDGYVSYRSYNRKSAYASLTIKPILKDVTELSVLKFDSINNGHHIADSQLGLQWTDPEDGDAIWDRTIVMVKKGTNPIMTESDGIVVYTCRQKSLHKTTPYVVDDLLVGQPYVLGVFPISKDGIVHVTKGNQIAATPGYYVRPLIFDDLSPMQYMGEWKISANIFRSTSDDTLCYFELGFPAKYGGVLSFDFEGHGLMHNGIFEVCFMDKVTNLSVYKYETDTDWKNVKLEVKSMDYLKIIFSARRGRFPIEVLLRNVRFDFNYYPKGDS